jgi:two-component system chemotaxis response regulator CheB
MAERKACRVLMVDGGLELGPLLAGLWSTETGLADAGACTFGEALSFTERLNPDVVLLDLGEPENGEAAALTAIEMVMADRPTPILALHRDEKPTHGTFSALQRGALDVARYPSPVTSGVLRELSRQLTLLAGVRVVQHIHGRRKRKQSEVVAPSFPYPVVAIAASLGGPKALAQLLELLPRALQAPILICQHISTGFTAPLAQWLAFQSRLPVEEAADLQEMVPGKVYVAPAGAHLKVSAEGKVRLDDGPPVNGFKPSCDAMLTSVAEGFRQRAIGVILTGMGKDGAQGLKEIRLRGGRTIAQDQASCVVFGMPREAIALGAAERVLPLDQIPAAIARMVAEC